MRQCAAENAGKKPGRRAGAQTGQWVFRPRPAQPCALSCRPFPCTGRPDTGGAVPVVCAVPDAAFAARARRQQAAPEQRRYSGHRVHSGAGAPQRDRRPDTGRPRRRRGKKRRAAVLALLLVCGLLLFGRLRGRFFRLLPGPPYRVAVDAGHGGGDPGAVGLAEEAQLTEQTARLLMELLEQDPNFIPLSCRDYDAAATPGERGRAAARQGAGLLLSIHANADPDGTAAGFECYPLLPGSDGHEESLRFAGLLAGEMAAAGAPLRGEGGVRYACYPEGSEQKIILERSETPPDGAQTFGVLEQAGCPAVLAEQCFVTSAEDLARFGGQEGCRRAAEAYYRAICGYFGTEPLL